MVSSLSRHGKAERQAADDGKISIPYLDLLNLYPSEKQLFSGRKFHEVMEIVPSSASGGDPDSDTERIGVIYIA